MRDGPPFRAAHDGVFIAVRLTPRSSRDAVEDIESAADGRSYLAAKVRAVPEKGAANAALERLIAAWLDVPKKSVSIVGGTTSRLKTVRVDGDPARLTERMAERLGMHRPK